ncbi:hypothetical protein ACTD5D_21800 [Nocardia takedensis]|uniref:hypothetical protein n=1 Tax=Nocardia takedensis TaxID=259390 RepID=UPI003F75EC18
MISTAYAVACDVLGEFAVGEPCVLTPDGTLVTERIVDATLRTKVSSWYAQHTGH